MKLFMKLYWLFGIMSAAVSFINPLIGAFGLVTFGILFVMGIWDINMRQRVRYYQNPEKLYNIGKNIKGSGQIHDLQMKTLPYSAVSICLGGKFVALFSIIMLFIMEAGPTAAGSMNVKRGYYHSMSPLNIIPKEQYITVGIPLGILAIILSVCMVISFWQRCEYYKMEIKGALK